MSFFRFSVRLIISTIVFVVTLFAAEIFLELIGSPVIPTLPSLTKICDSCSYIFELRPGVQGANSLGFRGPETSIQKEQNVFRIISAGDSVTYGAGVQEPESYPRQLEKKLHSKAHAVEVINGGVIGYTTFNEARYLEEKLSRFNPDVVILQTCWNDIVDPYVHWNYLSHINVIPPKEAFPVASEIVSAAKDNKFLVQKSFLQRSVIYGMLRLLWLNLNGNSMFRKTGTSVNGTYWPTFLSEDSDEEITDLLDYNSEKLQWFRREIVRAKKAAGSASFVLMIVPLAYQLEEGYPFSPEDQVLRLCREENLICLNLREKLAGYKPEEIFLMKQVDGGLVLPDVWHFNANGNSIVAGIVKEFLENQHIVAS